MTNISGAGGKGCVVEGVYHLTAGQTISYTLGGRGGHTQNGTDNKGKVNRAIKQAETECTATAAVPVKVQASGGASAVRLDGTVLLVAGGMGGGAGGNSPPSRRWNGRFELVRSNRYHY